MLRIIFMLTILLGIAHATMGHEPYESDDPFKRDIKTKLPNLCWGVFCKWCGENPPSVKRLLNYISIGESLYKEEISPVYRFT